MISSSIAIRNFKNSEILFKNWPNRRVHEFDDVSDTILPQKVQDTLQFSGKKYTSRRDYLKSSTTK